MTKMEGMQAGIQFAQTKPCNLLHPHGVGDACSGMQSRPKRLLFCFQPHISLLLKKRNEGPTVRPSLESRCQFHFPPWPPLLPSSFLSARFIAAPPLTHRVRCLHCFRWRHLGPFRPPPAHPKRVARMNKPLNTSHPPRGSV